jgi:hypothetical protein
MQRHVAGFTSHVESDPNNSTPQFTAVGG